MEKMKATIPSDLQELIEKSSGEDLSLVCSALLSHFTTTPIFHELLQQLVDPQATTCAKDATLSSTRKNDGNRAFSNRDFHQALQCYSQALCYAPLDSQDDKDAAAVLYVNRATAAYNLHLLEAVERDCSRALHLNQSYSKAWYRRARARADLRNLKQSILDMREALASEKSAGGRKQITLELEQMLGCASREQTEVCIREEISLKSDEVVLDGQLEKVWTLEKGWGLHSKSKIKPGSLLLVEGAYVAVILKEYRKSHCHFCFEELPCDLVPCNQCAMALFCSETCRESAIDKALLRLDDTKTCKTGKRWPEHMHECGGASWSFVLPTGVVLAARMFVRSFLEESHSVGLCSTKNEVLCQYYYLLSRADRIDTITVATVLSCCLQTSLHFINQAFQPTGHFVAQLVLLIAKVRVTAMAIVRTLSPDLDNSGNPLCSIQHVTVAQGIFLTGGTFNHSCDPNIHASFLSRQLYIRAIKPVAVGLPLELCYGAQVGEHCWRKRQKWLKEHYHFTCKCSVCSKTTFSDLASDAFLCQKIGCSGMVVKEGLFVDDKFLFASEEGCISHKDSEEKEYADEVHSQSKKHIAAGQCLACGCSLDMKTLDELSSTMEEKIECLLRIEDALSAMPLENNEALVEQALHSLGTLHGVLYACNKSLAKAEDIAAKILCSVRQFQMAVQHCETSVKILEQLYNKCHIVVANERLKLTSVAVAAAKLECAKYNLAEADKIFILHYGPNYAQELPYVTRLWKVLND